VSYTCRHILHRTCTCYNCLPGDEPLGSRHVHVEDVKNYIRFNIGAFCWSALYDCITMRCIYKWHQICRVESQWTRGLRPAWHSTNLGYDQNVCFDLRPCLELRPAPAPGWWAHIRYHV
jgi:hypothetical protein